MLDNHRAVPLSECQRAAARGASSVDIEGSAAQLADLGFDEHDRDGTPSISEGLPPLRTWELEPEPEQEPEFETNFKPQPEPEPWPQSNTWELEPEPEQGLEYEVDFEPRPEPEPWPESDS